MFGIPRRVPIKLIINMAAIITTRPISPLVILFWADSRAALSPPELIIPIAPERNTKINQIKATMVKSPMVLEMNLLKVEIPLPDGFPRGPIPLKPPGGASGMSASLFTVLGYWATKLPPDCRKVIVRKLLREQKSRQLRPNREVFARFCSKPRQLFSGRLQLT